MDVDLLVVRGHGESAIVEDFKGRDARGDGAAGDAGEAVGIVLVSATFASEKGQPQIAFLVKNRIVDRVGRGDVSVDGLRAHLNHKGACVMSDSHQFLCVINARIVGIDIEQNAPLGGDDAVAEGVQTDVALVVNGENVAIKELGPQHQGTVKTVGLAGVGEEGQIGGGNPGRALCAK